MSNLLSQIDFVKLQTDMAGRADDYRTAAPFPHTVIDGFLPAELLEVCLQEFPAALDRDGHEFDRSQERFKRSYNPDNLTSNVQAIFYALNSRPFLEALESLTGIEGLIPDPYYLGGGFHEIGTGGHLSVHADFNYHEKLNLERRINMLIYLNKDWEHEYGGQIEL